MPPPVTSPPTSSPRTGEPSDSLPAPELELRIVPSEIRKGESALLTWKARNASSVIIGPDIGTVDTEGKIKFFPEEATTYTVTAEGPGGSVSQSISVNVLGDFESSGMDRQDLPSEVASESFEEAVRPVFFDFDSAELTAEARLTLEGNARWLTKPEHLGTRFIVEGHSDERGSEEYNLALGDRRAQAVRDYLIAQAVDGARIQTISMGEEKPFDAGTSESSYALNRRAQLILLNGPGKVRKTDGE